MTPPAAAWNGAPLVLDVSFNVVAPQTPNGSAILAAVNQTTMNNLGRLSVSSEGQSRVLDVPALANQPSALLQNWQANSLSITNISVNDDTPIRIQLIGPGMPSIESQPLPIGPPGVNLGYGATALGTASAQPMHLVLSCAATECIVAVIGGPPDRCGNNAYLFALNAAAGDTGPPATNPPPPGYYATTSSSSYTFPFMWGSSDVFVANLSSRNANPVAVVMRQL